MNFLRQLFRDLWSQKLRSALTIFGIIWGTAAVTLLLAFGDGLQKKQLQAFAGLGEYIVITWPSRTSLPYAGLPKGRAIRVTDDDMGLIASKVENLFGISSEFSQGLLLNHGALRRRIEVSGVSPIFGEMRSLAPAAGGRFINDLDIALNRRVLFVGDELAKNVFGSADPIGQVVQLGGSPFLVIGVLKPKDQDSSYSGRDNDKAFMPGSTFRAMTGQRYVDNFIFKARSNKQTEQVKQDVVRTLAEKYHFDPNDREAMGMWDTTEMFTFLETFMAGFKSFLGIVGILTLVVGGIGVSNIMHVAVEERSKEIGIKMALGAKPRQILLQFLSETLLMTGLGGLIGIGLTLAICAVIANVPQITEYVGVPVVSPLVAALTALLLGLIGLVAGFFPAREASTLDPVVAMKL